MADNRYEHIFLGKDYYEQVGFTSPRTGGGKPIPRRNVSEHGQFLRSRLDQVWRKARETAEQRQAIALPTRSGIYLEFRSDPGAELVSKSLEDRRQGIRLLSVVERTVEREKDPATFATVFIPADKQGHFLRKIQKYETEETVGGKPKNRRLVDSIADIRLAMVSSFWQDSAAIPDTEALWCEAWIRVELGQEREIETRFRNQLAELNIQGTEGALEFPERTVIQILANAKQLTNLLEASDDIAEFRLAKQTAAFWLDMSNADQSEWVQDLLRRLQVSEDKSVAVCILDTGVNNGHPLIQPVLHDDDCHAVNPSWGVDDHDRHGTLMAGVSAFGDLQDILASGRRIRITHCLESVKIFPLFGQNPPHLYGYVTAQGISRAEIQSPDRKRIVCMAISSVDDRDRGRPSSWSGEIDKLASGAEDDSRRLILVAAGNTSPDEWRTYPDAMLTNSVHDPGQAWNALTVGAWTQKTAIRDPAFRNYTPVAPAGGISPFTSTSLTWEQKWPAKPDILMEGGNVAEDNNGDCSDIDDLCLLSTYYQPQVRHFADHNMTSAATALASHMAARLQASYPDAWPETIRALMVHSADWTHEMKEAFLEDESKSSYEKLIRICGYGVPNFERARQCATNTLTLISERELQPYDKDGGSYKTRDMHIHELPWPRDVLLGLGETEITMRVTLSYFIEPGPGQIGWKDRYRYASHGLRFDLNSPNESRNDFMIRLNKAAREDGQSPETASGSERWKIGATARDRGSIHSDLWQGPAANIAACNLIGVYPVIGWWRERPHLARWDRTTRYSLIVSVYTPEQDVDIYTPVATQVGIVTPVEIQIDELDE